jgi:hypothetical protein
MNLTPFRRPRFACDQKLSLAPSAEQKVATKPKQRPLPGKIELTGDSNLFIHSNPQLIHSLIVSMGEIGAVMMKVSTQKSAGQLELTGAW